MTASQAIGLYASSVGYGRGVALRFDQLHGLPVEAREGFSTEPPAHMGGKPIGKIAPRRNEGQARFHRCGIDRYIVRSHQPLDGTGYFALSKAIDLAQDPGEFAQSKKRQGNEFGLQKNPLSSLGLGRVIFCDDPHEDIRVGYNPHHRPAPPFAMDSFMSSTDTGRCPSRFSIPTTSEILHLPLRARSRISPLGDFSTSICSPGCTLRCWSRFYFKVIWPFAVTVRPVSGVRAVISQFRGCSLQVRQFCLAFTIGCFALWPVPAWSSPNDTRSEGDVAAKQSAIHPVATPLELAAWLARIPITSVFPPDFTDTLRGQAPAFLIETSTSPGCLPCADLWAKLGELRDLYGWRISTLNREQAMLRSGRLGLPWVGDPVVWVRPIGDEQRTIPIAIGTDRLPNLERNIYLAVKMLSGVRTNIGVHAMAKFTGLIGTNPSRDPGR